ncbi:MAG: calcium-translocating P-type ATPase, PMCA-type [Candidatus Coproplasma sp.]
MYYHHLPFDEVIKQVGSRRDGLSDAEAADRLTQNGKNALVAAKKKPAIVKFLSQFTDPMIIVLLVAAVISAVLAIVRSEYAELIDSGIILLIVVINAVIGFIQESKAENALEALKNKNKPYAKVLRGGQRKTILSEELVVGDIVFLEAGDIVPADMRLISSASLKIEESALTGESVPVDKNAEAVAEQNAALGDRLNMAYSGGTVSYGRGEGVVTATGMDTETGKIAKMLNEVKEAPSPLDRQLSKTAKILSVAVLAIAVIIFLVRAFAYGDYRDMNKLVDAFMTSVAIAVAAIPEGLPAVVTIVLAMGVRKMSTRRAIVKNLSSVETLGCCEVICSDKTGTLTLNKMTVKECYCPDKDEGLLRRIMALCNDAAQTSDGLVGDPTETALVAYAIDSGDNFSALTAAYPRVNEKPFDSVRKLMTTVHECEGEKVSYTKGAPDMLIARCKFIVKGGRVLPMTEEDKEAIKEANSRMAQKALRVLAAAYTDGENLDEENLVFVGLTGMIDPPRAEVKSAVAKCRSAGIHTIMITGDHVETAKAIARELDILRDGDLCATGAELDQISDEELYANIGKYAVFARVSPENKVRIVKAVKYNKQVVAMTGDGVNDAPSIKEADIGIGMGITGTQVSKDAADMILTDDNFATIVGAVEEGRKIFSNITKAIQFLLSANIAEVICLFIASVVLAGVVGATDPDFVFLTPVMILWVNLVTDSFPALSLGAERAESDVMAQPPRKSDKSLFSGNMGKDIVIQGVMQSALVMTSFCLGYFVLGSHEQASTMAFVSLCFIQLFHSFNLRSQRNSVLNKRFFANKYLDLSALLGIALTVAVVLIPGVNTVFRTAQLSGWEWLAAVGVSVAIIPLVELQKLIERAIYRKKNRV